MERSRAMSGKELPRKELLWKRTSQNLLLPMTHVLYKNCCFFIERRQTTDCDKIQRVLDKRNGVPALYARVDKRRKHY
jgi:hypothetical protein